MWWWYLFWILNNIVFIIWPTRRNIALTKLIQLSFLNDINIFYWKPNLLWNSVALNNVNGETIIFSLLEFSNVAKMFWLVPLQRCPAWWVSGPSGQAVLSPAGPQSAGGAGRSCRSHSTQGDAVPIWRSRPAVQSTGPSKGTATTHLVSNNRLGSFRTSVWSSHCSLTH